MNPRESPVLELPHGVRVLFTSGEQGNLSSTTGAGAVRAAAARERLRVDLGLVRLLWGRQVHGSEVLRDGAAGETCGDQQAGARSVSPGAAAGLGLPGAMVEADGYATAAPGVGAMVLVADCLPVALATPGAAAMLHAGWRGLAGGVLEEGVRALRELGGGGGLAAAIGPGAGVCCYEVGEEVHSAFGAAYRSGRHLDLRAIARERLQNAGVSKFGEVERCTICDEGLFSHRREGVRSGRQAGVAWLS